MRAYIGLTDLDWFEMLSREPGLEEVNFWQPGGGNLLKNLQPGELFLFKLHSPYHYIVGGGIYAHSTHLPIRLAWDSFGKANGTHTYQEMRASVARYRKQTDDSREDYTIGCILLESPFFFGRESWIPVPKDWKPQIQKGRYYDLTVEPGATLYAQVQQALAIQTTGDQPAERYGKPAEYVPRLGQGSFRVLVTDAYERRCQVTGERTLPALEAAHIKPYSLGGGHQVNNGLLLRRDLHALFDQGYVTITPQMDFEVSRRIREEFENGRDYYRLHGQHVREPVKPWMKPAGELLDWHNQQVFRG